MIRMLYMSPKTSNPWLLLATAIPLLCHVGPATAQSKQENDFEAAVAAASKGRAAGADAATSPGVNGADGIPASSQGTNGTSRYFRRNNLTVAERQADPTRAPRGLVPPEFRGKPTSPQHFEDARTAILRRRMDPYAYLVGATAGTVLPPEARLVACGGNSESLFYTLGTEDPVLLHNMAMRRAVRAGTVTAWTIPAPPKVAPGASPANTIARAAAFLTTHGYRAVPNRLRPNLFAPADERPGQASVRVNITEDGAMAMAFCGYAGEAPPPSGPGLEVRVHFPS